MNIDWLINLITPHEWAAILWVLIAVLASAETFKRSIVKYYVSRQKRGQYIYIFSLGVGMVTSFFVWPDQSHVPWFIFGLIAGPGSNFLHKGILVLIEWRSPRLAAILKGKKQSPAPPNDY